MNEATILANLEFAIKSDVILNDWCVEKYGQEPYIYTGLDPENPPPQAHYPLVALLADTRETGTAREDAETGVLLFMGINDATREVDGVEPRLIRYLGVANCIAFRRLVLGAVKSADLDGGVIVHGTGEYDTLLEFPLFHIMQAVTILRPYAFREDRIV